MTNERRQRLLCLLADDNGRYYYNGPIDGVWGPESQEAYERFLGDFLTADVEDKPTETGTFWDGIEFFTREEFRCQCGGKYCDGYPAEPQEKMVRIADAARKHFKRPANVVSGLRCETWNEIQGGVRNSQHRYGEACDLQIPGVTGAQLMAFLDTQPIRYAYIINDTNNVHFDIPKGKR